MSTSTSQGIYVATLRSDKLVPVTQDPRYVEICGRVNCFNVKVGKARNFAVRASNYWKDFGVDQVSFLVVAITPEIQAAETAVLRRLKQYRKQSPNGRMMDWLENISVERVVLTIHEALTDARISYQSPLP
jgi:hypothetical protein